MALQHFFADKVYLGSRTIPDFRVFPGLEVRRHFSYVYFCGSCGEIWGRLFHEGSDYTQLTQRPCAKHGNGILSCYPTWLDMPTRFEPDWPLDAVKREFNLLLAEAIKEMETSQ